MALSHRKIRVYELYGILFSTAVGGSDHHLPVLDLCSAFAAIEKKELPVDIVSQILLLGEVAVTDEVSVRECLTERLFRLCDIHVVGRLLIHTHIVDLELRLRKVGRRIRVSRPVAADSEVHLYEERLVERCRIRLVVFAFDRGEPVIYGKYQFIIGIKAHLARFPLDRVLMELRREAVCALLLDRALLLGMRLTIVDRRIGDRRIVSERLHNVDLTALRPLSVKRLVLRHHPDRRPESLTFRNFGRDHDFSVLEIGLILSRYFSGSIVILAILFGLNGL